MPASRSHNLSGALGILNAAMGKSLKLGGQILKQRMQERAPVWTGRMERSVRVSNVQKASDSIFVLVGPTVGYAKFTEEEPWIIGKRPGPKSQIKGATIPWMKPAADDVRDEVTALIRGALSLTVRALQRRLK